MKYKSLLLDVDGTLVPVGPHTMPSERVIKSLAKAREKVTISVVSGRALPWLTELFLALDLADPCIINGGSQIIDPRTKKIIWEQPLNKWDVEDILKKAKKDKISYLINDNGVEEKNPSHFNFSNPLSLQLSSFETKESSDQYLEILKTFPYVAAHKFFSWDKDRNYKMEIYITHKNASKQHAAEELAKILGVETAEMIGVGDARNDIPLLSVCGLRIAMGNADEKLKSMAHHVVPGVEEDGVAHVVETFILS